MTYLHYFARKENKEICELLLKYGADSTYRCTYYNLDNITPISVWPELENIIKRGPNAIVKLGGQARNNKLHSDVLVFLRENSSGL
jgi:hypothetical protein